MMHHYQIFFSFLAMIIPDLQKHVIKTFQQRNTYIISLTQFLFDHLGGEIWL